MTNKTFLTILLALSLCMTFGIGQVVAATGDCLSWIWGGKNESTTYSPPYTPPVASANSDSNPSGGQAASSAFLGQSTSSATPGYGASPPYTGARSDEYYPSSSQTALKPFQPAQPTTEMVPVVKKEWTYSPITSVAYKPVQQIDPQTGQSSTHYRVEESKTLLPWLHRKETIEYKPVLVPPKTLPPPAPGPQVVQANYASQPPQTHVAPATSARLCYDPCGNLVWIGNPDSESIPLSTTGDLVLSQTPNASSTVSTFVSRNTGTHNINYGIPPVREGFEPGNTRAYSQSYPGSTPASAADQVPVIHQNVQRPEITLQPLISEADLQPVHPFTEETTEELEITTAKPATLIKTPAPDLPTLRSPKKELARNEQIRYDKLVSPTRVIERYQP